jgi:hypothetical protein
MLDIRRRGCEPRCLLSFIFTATAPDTIGVDAAQTFHLSVLLNLLLCPAAPEPDARWARAKASEVAAAK